MNRLPRPPRLRPWIVAMVLVGATRVGGQAQAKISLGSLLESAADYLDAYSREFSAVVSEERYDQVATTGRAKVFRALRSDVMLINAGDAGWLGFRDVYEVDGKPVRDRDERLLQLFLHPSDRAVQQATKILDEGARFNIGSVNRTINVPTVALTFLRRETQPRSAFELGGEATIGGVRTSVVRFKEEALPRMIRTADDSPAQGRFWIEGGTGRVVRSELELDSRDAHGVITVTYAPQPKLSGLWVPTQMREHHTAGAARSIDCVATYSHFRQFTVDVTTKIIK